MREFVITESEQGVRLDKQLLKILDRSGSGFVHKMLRKKNITLNDCKADGSERLKAGDIIKIFLSEETFDKFASDKMQFAVRNLSGVELKDIIIYEDNRLLLVNKPAGILSQKALPTDISINELCLQYLTDRNELTPENLRMFKPSVCNRLDRNTSGLIIFAKDYKMSAAVNSALKERTIHKYYLCVAEGSLKEGGHYTGYLRKNRQENMVFISGKPSEGAARIESEIRPLLTGEAYTLAEVKLITGKSHQIRAQLSSLGHPLLGDRKYGGTSTAAFDTASGRILPDRGNKSSTDKSAKGQFLHAYRLEIPSDIKGELEYLAGRNFTAMPSLRMEKIIRDIFGVEINAYMEQQGIKGLDA